MTLSPKNDREIERDRYNDEAQKQFIASQGEDYILGAQAVALPYRRPYLHYEELISSNLSDKDLSCELASGYGLHTGVILRTGSTLVATDISEVSLGVLAENFKDFDRLSIHVADIEKLPFSDESFTAVLCAGGLSYGDNQLVISEILRILRPGGLFICVDSLNHNPIYKFNRMRHYLSGNRTKSTLLRMPTFHTIHSFRSNFSKVEVWYYGGASFIAPLLGKILNVYTITKIIDWADRVLKVNKMAFKFVMFAKK